MLASFRRHLNSWVARVFFLLLVGMFVIWGIGAGLGDAFQNLFGGGGSDVAATVAGRPVALADLQLLYQRQLAQVTQALGTKIDPTPEMKKGVAAQALQQLITEAATNAEVASLGLVVPDDALRQAVYAMPQFRGANGQFDHNQLVSVLQNNGLTEAKFLDLMRSDLGQQQLFEAARAGVVSPNILTTQVYEFQEEKRVADAVDIPFAAAPPPPAPTDAQLARWYENHPDSYSSPEYRRIKAVVLAPETVEKTMQVSDDDIKAAYQQHIAEYDQPEKRSVQVLLTKDRASAEALAALWASGADWATMQKQADASPVELTDATPTEFPAPELAKAVFAATPDTVAPPVQSPLGWHVFKVTKVTPGNQKTLDQARDELRAQILAGKAADVIDANAGKIEDLLAGGTALDDLPGDLGLGAVTGTLDAQGRTLDGQPAPIPGSDALRAALVAAAFQMKPGDPAQLTQGPPDTDGGATYFAVEVDQITPPAVKPQSAVADQVRADWTRDAVRHEQEIRAAGMLIAVKSGKTLAEAAALGGAPLTVHRLPPVGRASGAPGVPDQLVEPLFTLKPGEPTMVETPDGFTVAVLAAVQDPDPKADPIGTGQTRDGLVKAIGDDVQNVLSVALRDRGNPKVNTAVLDSVTQSN